MNGDKEMEALVAVIDGDAEFEMALGELVGRFRRRRDAAIRDQEAADLLYLGADNLRERFGGVSRRTVYYMAQRGRRKRVQVPA